MALDSTTCHNIITRVHICISLQETVICGRCYPFYCRTCGLSICCLKWNLVKTSNVIMLIDLYIYIFFLYMINYPVLNRAFIQSCSVIVRVRVALKRNVVCQ